MGDIGTLLNMVPKKENVMLEISIKIIIGKGIIAKRSASNFN